MIPILTLLLVIAFSMLVTKVATIALVNTGMTREMARFQARSALSGAGFTTAAAEDVVAHPVRRRIISMLILLGSAGLVTAVSTLLLGFLNPSSTSTEIRNVLILGAGVLLLFLSTRSEWIDRVLSRLIERSLKRYTRLNPRSMSQLIHVTGEYEIAELNCEEIHWLADKTLREAELNEEGILVLGIYREDEQYLGTPRGSYRIECGDRLVVYGRRDAIADLSRRHDPLEGKQRHADATEAQEEAQSEQDKANRRADS